MQYTEAVAHQPEADTFQFRGALQALVQAVTGHLWVIAATVALTLSLVVTYIWVWPEVYQAEVMLAIDSDKDTQRTAFYQGWNVFRKEALQDEATLLTSPPVLREVARRLNLRYDDVYHPFSRYALHLWTTSWVGRNWRALKNWVLGRKTEAGLSPEMVEIYKMLQDFSAGVSVQQVGEANMGLLVVRGSNRRVTEIANTLVQVYFEQRTQRYVAEARQAHAALLAETQRTAAELGQLDQQIRKFRADTGTLLLFEKDRGHINQFLVLRGAVVDLEAVVAENRAALAVLDQQLAAEGGKLRSDRMFKEEAAKERLPKLELALAAARVAYLPDSREVRDLEEQIREAQAALTGNQPNVVVRSAARIGENYEVLRAKRLQLESALAGAQSALAVKRVELARVQSMLEQIPAKMQTSHELDRSQGLLESKYNALQSKLAVAAVSMATASSAPPALRVVEPAREPEQPTHPQTKLLLLGALLAGLMVGVLAALTLEAALDRATRSRIERRAGLRMLGVVQAEARAAPLLLAGPSSSGTATAG